MTATRIETLWHEEGDGEYGPTWGNLTKIDSSLFQIGVENDRLGDYAVVSIDREALIKLWVAIGKELYPSPF